MDAPTTPSPLANPWITRCACLRNKAMYIDFEPDPSIPDTRDTFFWCRHTTTCLGPDGQIADEASCRPGRGCFEAL